MDRFERILAQVVQAQDSASMRSQSLPAWASHLSDDARIAQDLVYDVNAGALRAACIYQGLLLAVVALNGAQVRQVWRALTARAAGSPMPLYWLALGAGLVLAATLAIEHGFTH